MKTEALLAAGLVASATSAAVTSPLWPKPVTEQLGTNKAVLSHDFEFHSTQPSAFLDRAADRYQNLIFGSSVKTGGASSSGASSSPSTLTTISSCELQVDSVKKGGGEDESYELVISATGQCEVHAATLAGALHAMETFTQLLTRPAQGGVALDFLPVSITDKARFSHRGLLIDSSRHFLPVSEILQVIESLPMSKFNVLHWHIVDAQSFPMDSPSAPQLVQGAYSSSLTYSMAELQEVVQFGADRGVRVLLEIDVPGHAASWAHGYPEVMADCFEKYSYNINNFALNPTKEVTYSLLRDVLSDVVDATSAVTGEGGMVHIGGDEVVYGCWNNDTSILQYMEEHSMSPDDLLMMFAERADEMLRDLKVTPVHWEEVFLAGEQSGKQLDPADGAVFEVWTSKERVQSIVHAGFPVIAAPSDVWYLDHADNTWSVMYRYDPVAGLSSSEAALVVGGEVCMWGEHIDQSNLQSVVYPRAAAVGERLWSPAAGDGGVTEEEQEEAEMRLEVQRCRMQERGFRPGALNPGFCATTFV